MAIVLLLFIILMLVLAIPFVQTSLGNYATKKINEQYKTNINIDKVALRFNGDVSLKDVYIEDYKQDTLIFVRDIKASIVNFKNLYSGKLNFGDINLEALEFNIVTYKGEENTNLDVFVAKFDDNKPRKEPSDFLFSSSDISINNGHFKLVDENDETTDILNLDNVFINATNFLINGPNVSTRINTLSFNSKRGVSVKNMTTNFEYGLDHMDFKNLNIKTENSMLKGNLRFDYEREDLQFFEDKVQITANFKDSEIRLDELNKFYNEFGTEQQAKLAVELSGTLNDLTVKNLQYSSTTNTRIDADIIFKNLFSSDRDLFSMDANFRNLASNYYDLKAIFPNLLGEAIPTVFNKLGRFSMRGPAYITTSTIITNTEINTEIGFISSDLKLIKVDDIDYASYVGRLVFNDFNLGVLLEDNTFGTTSFNLNVDGRGFKLDNLKTKVQGFIFELNYNKYQYNDVYVSGSLGDRIFNGILKVNDENFKLDFDGLADFSQEVKNYNFNADVSYANLKELNFVTRDSIGIFKGKISVSASGSSIDDAFGTINITNTTYTNENDLYYFEDFVINSQFEKNKRTLAVNSPDIVEGYIIGDFKFLDIPKLVQNSLGHIYTNYQPFEIKNEQFLDFDFTIHDKIVNVFFKDIKFSENTSIKGRIETDASRFKLIFKAPFIGYTEKYNAENISFNINNSNPVYNTYIKIDSLSNNIYNFYDFNLINVTARDTLFIRTEFKGGIGNVDNYNLNLFYTIDDNNDFVVGLKKSDMNIKNYKWDINKNNDLTNKIVFDKDLKNFNINQIVINHEDEEMSLYGRIRDSTYKDLTLSFNEISLEKITPNIDSLSAKGDINGYLRLTQLDGVYLPSSDLMVTNLEVNKHQLGTLSALIMGDESLTNYTVDVLLQNDNLKSLEAKGNINFGKDNKSLNVAVNFDEFLIDPLNPLGEGVISDIRGLVSGSAVISGEMANPSIDGELYMDRTGLKIPYLNVDYGFDFDSKVILKGQQFIFDNVALTDTDFFSNGFLNGTISHTNFTDWKLDLRLNTDRLLVLNTEETEESLYYGTGYIAGTATIAGPTNALVIAVNGSTARGTVFNIPLNDISSFGDNTYIKFLTLEEKQARILGEFREDVLVSGLELDFDLDVNQNALIEIVIDKESGSTIKGRGSGNLLFEINTTGKFNMWGDFSVFEGIYNFRYGAFVQKEFNVEPGGTIVWDGEPLDARIDLKAIYRTDTNPSILLDNPTTQTIPVNLEINLSGKLEQPNPEFDFSFPSASSVVKSELEYRLSSKEERDKQALYLLATGGFAQGVNDFNITGTITERLNGIISSLIGNQDGNFNLGLNYQMGADGPDLQTDDRFGVTLQTKISDRVYLDGKVGVPIGGASETVIAGDVQIDFLLNQDGTLRAKVFNRQNEIQNFGEDIGYTQGLGISYNVEFDTFKELIRIIFKGKTKLPLTDTTKSTSEKKDDNLPDFISMKSADTSKKER
ncbi:translocation/assembly module TamB domain-containing protein [Paucihalobacter sp.]|uniref:translocation/assembly module TamB domain-containing protein n=1 Tax=Paucihalobacter sp. TaxID=2850405 RepID=UPI003D161E0F